MMKILARSAAVGLAAVLSWPAAAQTYQTYGAHNPSEVSPCQVENCVYKRKKGDPADPLWPIYWQSDWTMYRVYGPDAGKYPPPYQGKPPAGATYQTSYGKTYYDSTWVGKSGEGAMEERYDEYCLPIFPLDNHYSCKFISLGNVAYFIAGEGRPAWMPKICLFSGLNHPPRRDFISHLPYSKEDSARIGAGGQGYSFWVSAQNGYVMQVGASADLTDKGGILFGYGFQANSAGQVMPQSFYFSGYPLAPANAPYVSQNYTNFSVTQPSQDIWGEVAGIDPTTLPACQLFNPPEAAPQGLTTSAAPAKRAPTWGDIGRWRP
ncbi:hypothetical protein DD559_14465 [Sphingomonas pokkalii]|uniref:Uncharacterized protein n=1 Tax=Sphingomonas pokkalii TaxID=2175090 RepID=A0A2U0SGD8_9SPHN|nr:hypothetical protein DD559_14465 [Sphingomonas pokkalii]